MPLAFTNYLEFLTWLQEIAGRMPRVLPVLQRLVINLQNDIADLIAAAYGRSAAAGVLEMPQGVGRASGRAMTPEESAAESNCIAALNAALPRGAAAGAGATPRQLWDGTFLRAIFDLLVSNPALLQWLMGLLMKSPA